MKRTIWTFSIVLFAWGCNNESETASVKDVSTGVELLSEDSTSIPNAIKLLIDSIAKFNPGDSSLFTLAEDPKANCTGIPMTRADLQSHRTVLKIFEGKKNAGLAVPGFGGVGLGSEETSYNVYYLEPKVVTCDTGEVVFGCGYSIHLLIKKVKRKLDISKLPWVAASVQLESNKTQVFYSLQSHGMQGLLLVKFFKPVVNKPFDVEGFGIMQSSIDGIHNILGDSLLSSKIKFTPEHISFVTPQDLRQ